MKRFLWLLLGGILILSGCGAPAPSGDGVSVVAVSFPGYSFAKEIAGDTAEVTLLLPFGSEAHGYEPTPKDILKIQSCDLFIYGGGESEHWVDEVLAAAGGNMQTVAMLDCVVLQEEETAEGMETEAHDTHTEADEHVWTDPKNAMRIADAVADALCTAAPNHKAQYAENLRVYTEKLQALDTAFSETLAACENREIVVGDRFPFLYMAKAYDLDYYAAFPGCAGESEPSAATVAFLIDKVRADQIPVVFYTEFSDQKVANTICEATGAKPLLLHSCHNVTKAEFEAGESYLTLMEQNLENLKEALQCS